LSSGRFQRGVGRILFGGGSLGYVARNQRHDADSEDHGAGAAEEDFGPIPHVPQGHPEDGAFVGRQFHDQEWGFAAKQRAFEQPGHEESDRNAQEIHGQEGESLELDKAEDDAVGDASGNEQRVDGQPGGATHERGDQDGDEAVLGGFDGAGRHDARDGAREGAEHGDEAFAVQPDFAHHAVHEEGRPGHVSRIFEQPMKKNSSRICGRNTTTAPTPATTPSTSRLRRSPGGEQADPIQRAGVTPGVERVHGPLGEGEDALEHERHDSDEDQRAPVGVGDDAIEPVAERFGIGRLGGGRSLVDGTGARVAAFDGDGAPVDAERFEP
jgi:hypothetical protein